MLPKHGIAHGAFLLAYTARLSPAASLDALVDTARNQQSYLASATDLEAPASGLRALNLLRCEGRVTLDARLEALSHAADRGTMLGFARILLEGFPPVWLWSAVDRRQVLREYIPSADLEALAWLEPELDALLLGVHAKLNAVRQEQIAKRIGDAAEEILMAAFRFEGRSPVHVARFYDGCGYDIELPTLPLDRIEVKAASTNTRGRFRLTRNEFDQSTKFGAEWRVLQVVFTSEAFFADRVGCGHVVEIIAVSSSAVSQLAAADTPEFRWMESAEFAPASPDWIKVAISLDPEFSVLGFHAQRPASSA